MACGTIAALGLGLGGAGVDMYANNQVRNKMNSDTSAELARQKQYQNQASNVFDQSLNKSTPQAANQQIGQGQQQLAGLINQVQGVPLSASMPSFGDTNSQTQQAKQGMSNKAASTLGGYGNFGLQQNIKDLQANSQLGLISGQARQSANVLPYELQQAQNSEQGLQSIGSLMSMAGMLAGLGGMMMPAGAALPASQTGAWMNEFNGMGLPGMTGSGALPAMNFGSFAGFA